MRAGCPRPEDTSKTTSKSNCAAVPELLPDFSALAAAITATSKVFLLGLSGFWAIWRRWFAPEALGALSALVANLTLPCLIFTHFAHEFDPQTFPHWWVVALAGLAFQGVTFALGWLASRRTSVENGRNEMTMLIAFQNSGFFVLPMLQALLPPHQFARAALWLWVFIIAFNALVWPVGTWALRGKRDAGLRRLLTLPPTLATIFALVIFGFFHDAIAPLRTTHVWDVLLGGETPGAIALLGELTVPLATLILGGTIAATLVAKQQVRIGRASLETNAWKLVILPLLGWALIRFWPTPLFEQDRVLRLIVMLQFAAPSAMNIAVFCQQFGVPMRLTPAACLLGYVLCIVTVPLWISLVL